jgi:hypothetical protein
MSVIRLCAGPMQCVYLVESWGNLVLAQLICFNAVLYQHVLNGAYLNWFNVKEREGGKGKELLTEWPKNGIRKEYVINERMRYILPHIT